MSEFISQLLADLEKIHGVHKLGRSCLNSENYHFADGTTVRITASYGFIYVEQVLAVNSDPTCPPRDLRD